jgi:hypothetical protein
MVVGSTAHAAHAWQASFHKAMNAHTSFANITFTANGPVDVAQLTSLFVDSVFYGNCFAFSDCISC